MPDASIAKRIRPAHIQRQACHIQDIAMGGQAIVDPEGVGKRFRSIFVGIEEDKYVILRAPGSRDHLYPEKPVTVRFLHNGQVRGFRSKILGLVNFPYALLFLEYPGVIELLNLRRHERVDSFLPATIYYEGVEARCMVLNLSLSGCRLLIAFDDLQGIPDLDKGAEVAVNVRLMGAETDAFLEGIVNNAPKENDRLFLGVEFTDMTEELKDMLENHAAYVLKAQG